LGDFARAAPAQNRPKLSGRHTKCVSPDAIKNCYMAIALIQQNIETG
jgi:hypothetical protein